MSAGAPVHIIAGSWPPMEGGLSDHSHILSSGLARRGYEVHVWASRAGTQPPPDGVRVHARMARWSLAELRDVGRELDRLPGPRRIVVQWVPHDFGWRSLNVALPAWLLARARRGDVVLPLVHEGGLPFRTRRLAILVGAAVHRLMAAMLLRAARGHVWITVPRWRHMLRPWALGRRLEWEWLPVPSNIQPREDAAGAARVRAAHAAGAREVVGSFGLHGGPSTPPLARVLARLLADAGRVAIIIGPRGELVRDAVAALDRDAATRVRVVGPLPAAEVSAHLGACDVLVQPFIDGVSARRGSAMAAIAHGRPLVTSDGAWTEPVWREERAAALAADDDAMAGAAEALLADPAERARLGARGRETYARHFAPERMIDRVAATLGAP